MNRFTRVRRTLQRPEGPRSGAAGSVKGLLPKHRRGRSAQLERDPLRGRSGPNIAGRRGRRRSARSTSDVHLGTGRAPRFGQHALEMRP
jgi:hypothetical protein